MINYNVSIYISSDKLYINDILVKEEKNMSDGTQLYVVDGVLFTYAADIPEAWSKMIKQDGPSCPFGECK